MKKIDKDKLRNLILKGISSEKLNSRYDYSDITDMYSMFYKCNNLKDIDPWNYHLFDFTELNNQLLKEKYPEHYI